MREILILLVALCVTEFVHCLIEIWGMRQKVEWLRLSLNNKQHGRWPININTKAKTAIFHASILLLITGTSYILLLFLNLKTESLITLGVTVLLINYIIVTWKVDAFHGEIGVLIKKAKKDKTMT